MVGKTKPVKTMTNFKAPKLPETYKGENYLTVNVMTEV